MRCKRVKRLICAALDGELADERARAVRAHLAGCGSCADFAAGVRQVARNLDRWDTPEPRPGFAGRVLARLPEQQEPVDFVGGWIQLLRPAPLAACVAAFCFGAALVAFSNGNGEASVRAVPPGVPDLAGDYLDALTDDAVEETLLSLLPSTER